MSGKDFEQQVRETMGPWRLDPSGEVWTRLESGLQQKKKRRRAFYLFLLAGLMVGGMLWRYGVEEKTPVEPGIAGSAQDVQSIRPSGVNPSTDLPARPGTSTADAGMGATGLRVPDAAAQSTIAKTPKPFQNKVSVAVISDQRAVNAITDVNEPVSDRPQKTGLSVEVGMEKVQPDVKTHHSLSHPFPVAEKLNTIAPGSLATVAIPSPSPGKEQAAEKYVSRKKINFGIAAGVGRSAYTEGLSISTAKAADLQSGPVSGGASGSPFPSANYDYRQDPAAGWSLGGWMQLPLSRQWSFQAGLTYQQYSTRTPVGISAGDSTILYFNGRNNQLSNVGYQPGNGNEHRNRYHLLQLPLSLEWQINKGRKLPVIWAMGLVPGYLLSSNALVMDSSQALYHHPDNQRLFQLGLRTGVFFRLRPSAAHPLELGPVLQYQLNPVFTDAMKHNGHLYYFGMEARVPIFSRTARQR